MTPEKCKEMADKAKPHLDIIICKYEISGEGCTSSVENAEGWGNLTFHFLNTIVIGVVSSRIPIFVLIVFMAKIGWVRPCQILVRLHSHQDDSQLVHSGHSLEQK